jgi:hypothetical protein
VSSFEAGLKTRGDRVPQALSCISVTRCSASRIHADDTLGDRRRVRHVRFIARAYMLACNAMGRWDRRALQSLGAYRVHPVGRSSTGTSDTAPTRKDPAQACGLRATR